MNDQTHMLYPDNLRARVKGVDVSRLQVRVNGDGVVRMQGLHPTGVSSPWWGFGPDALRKAKADILQEEEAPVALRVREGGEWVTKYEGRAVRRFADGTHSWKGGKLSAYVDLSDFTPRIPAGLLQAAAGAEAGQVA